MINNINANWKFKRVRCLDDGVLGIVLGISKLGNLRICWDNDMITYENPIEMSSYICLHKD